jgi:hypothetical protein
MRDPLDSNDLPRDDAPVLPASPFDHPEVVMSDQPSNRWQGLNALSGLLAAVLIPIVIAIMGYRYTSALKEREIQSHFVELALSVLKEPPRAENRAVRQWAVRVVDEYSGVALGETASRELLDSVSLPTPASTTSRVYLLAGRREKASALDSLHADLVRAGFNVVGQKPALQDKGRPAGPEVRYFNTTDRAEAEAIAEWLRFRLRAPGLEAHGYRDTSVRPGYIEIWLGR